MNWFFGIIPQHLKTDFDYFFYLVHGVVTLHDNILNALENTLQ